MCIQYLILLTNMSKVLDIACIFIFITPMQVIAAEGELKASQALMEAAEVIHLSPHALQVETYFQGQYMTLTPNYYFSRDICRFLTPYPLSIIPRSSFQCPSAFQAWLSWTCSMTRSCYRCGFVIQMLLNALMFFRKFLCSNAAINYIAYSCKDKQFGVSKYIVKTTMNIKMRYTNFKLGI